MPMRMQSVEEATKIFAQNISWFSRKKFAKYGHMQKNMAKWVIPEKSIQNAAQRRWPQVHRTLHWKVMAKNFFLGMRATPF